MKKLIWVPMVHTHEEMSRFHPDVKRDDVLEDRKEAVWTKINIALDALDFGFSPIKIFIENLVDEADMSLEDWGPTSRAVKKLVDKGGKIIPVEDGSIVELRSKSWEKIINWSGLRSLELANGNGYEFYDTMYKLYREEEGIGVKEDQAIASGINQNLQDGETGILFTGYGHNVGEHLAGFNDIEFVVIAQDALEMLAKLTEDYPFLNENSERFRELRDAISLQVRGPERK